MTKPFHQTYLLLPLVFITWWTLTFGFKTTTHNNSTLNANTINLTSTKDTNIAGANIHATQSTNLNVGGDLTVVSLQDSHSEKSLGVNVSAGFSSDDNIDQATGEVTGHTDSSRASISGHTNSGNYQSVTNQTSITGANVNVDTKGNTHLKGAVIAGSEATSITTATLTSENITNKADYESMSGGLNYASSTTTVENRESNNEYSTEPQNQSTSGVTPDVGLPQEVEKSSTTHTALAQNTVINITDKTNQTQDTDKISRDTDNAHFTMTEINTEVLQIRENISNEVAIEGFKAVGDLAMKEGWEDGSVEKTLAHVAVGAVVAGIGNGDAISGALGAGSRELASTLTEGKDDATQQNVSTLVGAVVGGGTGASVALDGEKYNRQLHQKEIEWIDDNAEAFAQEQGITPEEAKQQLSNQALRDVDVIWSAVLGEEDVDAKAFIAKNSQGETFSDGLFSSHGLFTVEGSEYYNPNVYIEAQKTNPDFYKRAQEVGKEILSDPAKLREAVAAKITVKTLESIQDMAITKVDQVAQLAQLADDLDKGKISKDQAYDTLVTSSNKCNFS